MDRDKLIQRLRATFLIELREHVESFNRELLSLERDSNAATRAESIKTLFRVAHSLKGAARAVSASKLESVCHKLEELLSGLRDGTRELTPEIFETLFAAVDSFEEAGRTFGAPEAPPVAAAPPPQAAEAPQAVDAPPVRPARSLPPPAAPVASPPLERRPQPIAASAARTAAAAPPERSESAPQAEQMVRLPERKLDSLLGCSGELLLARRRLDARAAELGELHEHVAGVRAALAQAEHARRKKPRRAQSNGNGHLQLAVDVGHDAAAALEATRARLALLESALESYTGALADDTRQLERASRTLDERIHELRMQPFSLACEALFRTVRDLAARHDKPTELLLEGGEIELDRSLIDALRAPLLHLVRNAVDHGIERAAERSAAGKPARAQLKVSAAVRGELVQIDVRDDGRGIDLEAIRAKLRHHGVSPRDDQEALRSIFEAGFSTARTVTDVSGRGVGLDVVRSQIEGLRGTVGVTFQPGAGTCFTLTLPLTVSTLRALVVRAGAELFALPSASILRLQRAAANELAVVQGRESLLTSSAPLPLASLGDLLGLETVPHAAGSKLPIVVLGQAGDSVALAVDELIAEQDVVIKPLGRRIQRLKHVSGATILPNGRVALLLHAGELLRSSVTRTPARRISQEQTAAPARKRLLLVDDSATTRTLEKSILQAAGFDVLTAVDGANAWQLLQEHGADLVVSDVEMPNMNGFALTDAIRGSKRFRELPVILLTSLDSEQDRARGMASGADAYLVKSAFDQGNLLETIRQLL